MISRPERVDEYHDRLVEECCEGAVIMRLRYHNQPILPNVRGDADNPAWHAMHERVPIAQVVPSLAVQVAAKLLDNRLRAYVPGSGRKPPPPNTSFAAAYFDHDGVRTYVLASAECATCDGERKRWGEGWHLYTCPACDGTGARTDVRAIADRYQPDRPWRDEDTPRLARFVVTPRFMMRQLWEDLAIWSQRTFGPDSERDYVGPLYHLHREVDEALAAPVEDLAEELADCLLLVLDAARRAGLTFDEFRITASTKLRKNEDRTYGPPDHEGVSEHIRTLVDRQRHDRDQRADGDDQ
jgi:hypothetical protein